MPRSTSPSSSRCKRNSSNCTRGSRTAARRSRTPEAIRYNEGAGDLYGAAQTRFNVASALADSGRMADAREYARAALRNFETYGAGAAQDIQDTQQLPAWLDAQPQ